MTKPLVSIIIPTYNRADLIAETLESVQRQTYPHFECIVIDDGSTDHTEEVVSAFAKADKRFSYHLRPSTRAKGGNGARNHGIKLSKGAYLNFLDSDDLFTPNKIESQLNLLREHDDAIATCYWDYFTNDPPQKNSVRKYPVFTSFDKMDLFLDALGWSETFFPPHAYLVPRGIIDRAGEWDERLSINQDGEFFSRVFVQTTRVMYTSKTTVFYREHGGDRTSQRLNEFKMSQAIESWKKIENLYLETFGRKTTQIKMAKKYLYQNYLPSSPLIIKKYKDFFEPVIPKKRSFTIKFLSLIKKTIRRIK